MSAPSRQRGTTLFAVLVGTIIFGQAFGIAIHVLNTTGDMKASTHLQGMATVEHRRNLEAIANVLLAAAADTLDNFDPYTDATDEPWFERVTGETNGERTLSGPESLEWRAVPPVAGIGSAGRIVHVTDGGELVVADQVVGGSFLVERDGRSLTIHLTTYEVASGAAPVQVEGGTAIFVRNGP